MSKKQNLNESFSQYVQVISLTFIKLLSLSKTFIKYYRKPARLHNLPIDELKTL